MLIYQIKSNNTAKKSILIESSAAPADISTEEGKHAIFLRSLKGCVFKPGQRVRRHGTPNKGRISTINFSFKDVMWCDFGQPLYIEVEWDDGTKTMCNPSSLTLKRAK